MLTKPALSISDAKKIAAAAVEEAEKNGWTVVVAIIDDGGNLMYLEKMDGTQLGSVVVAQEKGRTALLFKRPSKALEDAVLGGRPVMMTMPQATTIEGGLPLTYQGQIVGAIGISGVQSFQDGQIAAAGVKALEALA
ncbi:GlcG/HbpS family heme-binding protein [Indioceanicola profundi]|uniref:GlcG/HbpS family heme-binding protein n=1 Tax=Indioceanicola profundi TaxID=2220096 RepID=UPI000E6ABFE9|nr:heme-binding protein [Indioceanicola profundi]